MTQNYTGMRKGISLVEIMIAIVLFAALSVISLKYAKNYFDTDTAAKKARVAAVTEQAAQLLGAYQILKTELGTIPADTNISAFSGSAGILTSTPATVTEMSNTGWKFTTDYNGTTLPAFYIELDKYTTASEVLDVKKNCAIFNREFNATDGNSSLTATTFYTTGSASASKTAAARNQFCYSKDVNTTVITVFVP